MISIVDGNLLTGEAEAIVNTVNTVGIMGKGIALQVKQAFPEVFTEYERAAKKGDVEIGRMHVVRTNRLENPKYVINFPTKTHWKSKSRLADIDAGLKDLVAVIRDLNIKSVAVPPLGCGNGGLRWEQVGPLIVEALEGLEAEVFLYRPHGAPEPDSMPVGTKKPSMTPLRAGLIKLFSEYAVPGYRLTMLEVQKLAYFWELAGRPTGLNFVKQKYGPYSEKLNFALQRLEGHYIRGYGDRSRDSSITLLEGALETADTAFVGHEEELIRVRRVAELIDGYETPYGMELLATVHWVMANDSGAWSSEDLTIEAVHSWNARKKEVFRPKHIKIAWETLRNTKWPWG